MEIWAAEEVGREKFSSSVPSRRQSVRRLTERETKATSGDLHIHAHYCSTDSNRKQHQTSGSATGEWRAKCGT